MVFNYKPSIRECIEGSYKEGFELIWEQVGNTIEIERSSLKTWRSFFNGIDARITSELKKYYPHLSIKWC